MPKATRKPSSRRRDEGSASRTMLSSDRPKLRSTPLIKYNFEPLHNINFVRVLEILPGKKEDKIHCRLHVRSMREAAETYTAISYVWGDSTETLEIIVDYKAMDITINLYDALWALRYPKMARFVWADAICINQQDNTEKGHQVKRMGEIFKNAMKVLVWLGKDSQGVAKNCFNLIRDTNKYLAAQFDQYGGWDLIPTITQQCPISRDRSRWSNVEALIRLPWFKRLWVIQEAALARECHLMWGRQLMDIAQIYELSCWLNNRIDLLDLVGHIGANLLIDCFYDGHCSYDNPKTWRANLPNLRFTRDCGDRYGRKFLYLLRMGGMVQASLDVDRVYAFLGSWLARKVDAPQQLLIEPDYSKSVDEVYFETACALLEHPREAPDLLASVNHHIEVCVNADDFPSWVPRWDKSGAPGSFSLSSHWYQAGGLDGKFSAHVQNDKSLSLGVVIFDTLTWTSEYLYERNFSLVPDDWTINLKNSGVPFIDSLWHQVIRITNRSAEKHQAAHEVLQATKDEFSQTLVVGYPLDQSWKAENGDLAKHRRDFDAYCKNVQSKIPPSLSGTPSVRRPLDVAGNPYNILHPLICIDERKLAVTKFGRFCIVPKYSKPGDICCISPGMQVPIILRARKGGRFGLVGDSYIRGTMTGEIMDQLDNGVVELEDILIV
jgi:Heterokaryon incompatibility protein (HET)